KNRAVSVLGRSLFSLHPGRWLPDITAARGCQDGDSVLCWPSDCPSAVQVDIEYFDVAAHQLGQLPSYYGRPSRQLTDCSASLIFTIGIVAGHYGNSLYGP